MKIQFLIIGVIMVSANVFAQEVSTVMFQKLDSLLSDAYDKGIFTGQVIISHQGKKYIINNTVTRTGTQAERWTRIPCSTLDH